MGDTSLAPRTVGIDKFYFKKVDVTWGTFNNNADAAVTLKTKNSILLINEGNSIVEVSFNGNTVHGELNPSNGTGSLKIDDTSIVKIWFRLKTGKSSIIRIQNDASINSGFTSTASSPTGSERSDIDAFGRLRVSNPYTLFENKQISDNGSLIWNSTTASGGSTTYSSYRASTKLIVTSTINSKVIRQTKQRFSYQSGKSLLILTTFVMGAGQEGVSKKAGYFDQDNGIFFQNNGNVNSLVIRSSVSGTADDNEVNQEDWSIDPMDGYGPSGITLDIEKAQIFFVDIEWLGVGSVRCGFVINGNIYYVHRFDHANIIDSVYMSTPNLPVRYEIQNLSSATGSSLEQICCSVISEGGYENQGLSFAIDRGISSLSGVDNTQLYPLISIRHKLGAYGYQILPQFLDVLCTSSNATFKWALILNPTIAGTDAASWVDVTGSAVQYDASRTLLNYLTGGTTIVSGYGSQKVTTSTSLVQGILTLGTTIAGVRDELVLAVQKVGSGGSTDEFIGSLNWKEFA